MMKKTPERRLLAAALSAALVLNGLTPALAAGDFSSSATGTSTAQFLQLGVGARGEAMGGAYSAVADGVDALYWNPAGLSAVQDSEVTVMHAPYIASSFYDFAGYARKTGPGTLALGLQYFSAGSVSETDASGASIGSVTPNDLAVSVGYGYKFADGPLSGFSLGASAKYIQSTLATTAETEALDLGLLSPKLLNDKLGLAATVTNLGGTMKFDSVPENLPLAIRLGSSYQIVPGWLAALDLIFPRNNGPQWDLGTEYRFAASNDVSLAGRLGYSSISDGISGFTGFTMGLGFTFQQIALDYGFIPYGDLGLTHRISLTFHFGDTTPAQEQPAKAAEASAPPDSLNLHLAAARKFAAIPEPAQAAAAYREALDQAPNDPQIHMELAQTLMVLSDYSNARLEWQEADNLLPADDARRVRTGANQAAISVAQEQLKAAKTQYLAALAFAKEHKLANADVVDAYAGFAHCLALDGQNDNAILNYKKAWSLARDKATRGRIAAQILALGGQVGTDAP